MAIGKSMAARLGDRQGQRTDLGLPQKVAEVGQETLDLAAEHAGFGNHEIYRQAEKVCDEVAAVVIALRKRQWSSDPWR